LGTLAGYAAIVLMVLIGVGLVIFVHELGHFLVAKACGVKCEKFYLGFDVPIKIGPVTLPRTLGKFQWGETEYGIGIIPLGGYVKMLGQDDNPANAQREAERIRVAKVSAADPAARDQHEPELVSDAAAEYELDPRSYPAKSVPQRMAIISAGVIMNLIFAVIFAAVAYRTGVPYEPCEIGGTSAGSPAWTHNMPLGARIVQIERDGRESQHLRFDWDLRQQIALRGLGEEPKPIDLQLQLPDGTREWFTVVPSDRLVRRGISDFATIGVRPTDSTTLAQDLPFVPHMAAGRAEPPFQSGDRIVAVNGQGIDPSRANEQGELPADALESALAAHVNEPITVVVARRDTAPHLTAEDAIRQLEITIPPNPLRQVGLEMHMGPVEAVREDSPAARAGIQVGDLIRRVNGEPVGDPCLLSPRLAAAIGHPVELELERPGASPSTTITVTVVPEARARFDITLTPSTLAAVESIGVAYAVRNDVAAVEPGSPAAAAGVQAGDVIRSALFLATTKEAETQVKQLFGGALLSEAIPFDAQQENWAYVLHLLQLVPTGTALQLELQRAGKALTVALVPVDSAAYFYLDRGLRLTSLTRIHTAASWSEAWHLGLRETKEQLQRVLNFLGKFFTFRVSPKTLGGPLMIAAAAGSEASQGVPRLLLFLTLLSANLAILNFLPIPALDGGHMVFLTAEAVTGKPVDERLQGTLTLIGVVCLLGLMVFVFANDIGRLFL
jgi:regulator of sigma E protease